MPVLLILRVEKAAVPPTAATAVVPVSVAPAVPLPGVIAIVTVPVKLGTGLPPASCAATWIAGVIVVPATVDTGCTVKTSFAAAPTSTENALLVAPLTPPAAVDTARVYPLPALSMLRVEKLATPAAAVTVVVPDRVPLDGFAWIATATSCVKPVAVLPSASRAVTWTAGVMAAPAAVFVGWTVMTSCVAEPGLIVNELLVAPVSPVAVAVRV